MIERNDLCLIARPVALAGLLFAAAATGQEQAPQGFVGNRDLAGLFVPKGAGFAQKFGVKDVRGDARLYGRVGFDGAGGGDAKYGEQLADDRQGRSATRLTAIGGLAADVHFWGELREVAALEVKYELAPGSAELGRARSDATTGRPRADAMDSPAHPGQRYADAAADQAGGTATPGDLSLAMRVCGFTVRLDDAKGTTPAQMLQDGTGRSSGRLGPKWLVPGNVNVQLMVGPLPVLIRANAGVGVELGFSAFDDQVRVGAATHRQVGIDITAGGSLNGWVSAGVGAGCKLGSVCVGLKADLRLLDVAAGPRLGVDCSDGLFAQLGYKLDPAAFTLRAIACFEVVVKCFRIGRSFEHVLFQWSAPATQGVLGG